jgi:hypothetical protein
VGASSNHVCAMCPTVEMGEARPFLLGYHSRDRTTVVSHLPVATEGYRLLVYRHIVLVIGAICQVHQAPPKVPTLVFMNRIGLYHIGRCRILDTG